MATPRINAHNTDDQPEMSRQHVLLEPAIALTGSSDVQHHDIRLQLQRILASPSFRNSKRSIQFLRFVVERALSGKTADIKERLIGVEVFERPADYDLGVDPIVRVAAGEVRKRIAQYYAEADHAGEFRIELPPGSYIPVFHWPNAALRKDLTPFEPVRSQTKESTANLFENNSHPYARSERHWQIPVLLASIILVTAIGIVFVARSFNAQSANRSLDAFWAPLMNGGDSITVCVGDLNYIFKAPPFSNALQLHPTADNLLNPNVGGALLRVGSLLGSRSKRFTFRLADLTGLNDLRQQPLILIGGMNNPWTQRILAGFRYQLTTRPGGINGDYGLVIDEANPTLTKWRVDLYAPLNLLTRDYSLVTRINDPLTGEPVVILAGLGPYGTAAASEFVSNPSYFSQFSSQAPKGWENHNIQILLESTVVDGRVSVPHVVAEQVSK